MSYSFSVASLAADERASLLSDHKTPGQAKSTSSSIVSKQGKENRRPLPGKYLPISDVFSFSVAEMEKRDFSLMEFLRLEPGSRGYPKSLAAQKAQYEARAALEWVEDFCEDFSKPISESEKVHMKPDLLHYYETGVPNSQFYLKKLNKYWKAFRRTANKGFFPC